jgi:hypothetical protein
MLFDDDEPLWIDFGIIFSVARLLVVLFICLFVIFAG